MKEWKYLIGSADDFIDAPEWAAVRLRHTGGKFVFAASLIAGSKRTEMHGDGTCRLVAPHEWTLIAQRTESFGNAIDMEFCKANPDHPDCKCKEQPSKYNRPCKGVTIDVYDVLQAFTVTNPATQHAIKKLLCAGLRGHKDKMQDLTEALKSIERAIELEKE